jgi:signal transduction histidine kinase/CheY-like chemotaxis protein
MAAPAALAPARQTATPCVEAVMPAFLHLLFDTRDFPARWYCGNWSSLHGWVHILGDSAISGAYFAIPCVLVYFVLRRRDVPFPPVFWLFAAFILSCGIGHLVEATLFWQPWYRLSATAKVITAVVSWATVFALIPLVPRALALPGLAIVNEQLRQEIARRERAEEERLQIERQMQQSQKLESLGILAGGIAHDFNNLLTAILGYADLARRSLPENAPAGPMLEEVISGSRRAAELTNQMLAYSGKGQFVVQPINLNELVGGMTRLLHVSISKKCRLTFVGDPKPPMVEADPAQLQQVVLNLIVNASEAIGDQEGEIRVSTGRQFCDRTVLAQSFLDENLPEGEYACLEVSDTGCGMSDETKARIFDPFFSTKFTGRGLGLAAVLGIIRGHRGAIIVESAVGRGSRFRVLLPLLKDGQAAQAAQQSPRNERWTGSGTVLLFEDEDPVRELAAFMLRRCGFEVLATADPRAGLAEFQRQPDRFTLVLLDMTMPHLSGVEVLRNIRRIKPSAIVVLSSGYDESQLLSQLEPREVDAFLHKPYTYQELQQAVRQALTSSPRAAQHPSP